MWPPPEPPTQPTGGVKDVKPDASKPCDQPVSLKPQDVILSGLTTIASGNNLFYSLADRYRVGHGAFWWNVGFQESLCSRVPCWKWWDLNLQKPLKWGQLLHCPRSDSRFSLRHQQGRSERRLKPTYNPAIPLHILSHTCSRFTICTALLYCQYLNQNSYMSVTNTNDF